MTQAMGAVLTYRHELGMNYNFIRPDLIVGSCLQVFFTPQDVDKLRRIGVKTIFCLQQDPDLEYFGVDISSIQAYAKTCSDIEHIRCEIRDFDAFDLRMHLPAMVSTLYKAVKRNRGVTYVHCTAGMGRAPAVALTYMSWVQGYKLMEARKITYVLTYWNELGMKYNIIRPGLLVGSRLQDPDLERPSKALYFFLSMYIIIFADSLDCVRKNDLCLDQYFQIFKLE